MQKLFRTTTILVLCLGVQVCAFGQANVAPGLTNLNDPSSQLWNAGLTVVDTNATVTDPDSANFGGGYLSVKVVGGLATDRLSIRSVTTSGNINVLGNDVRVVAGPVFTSIGTIAGTIPATGATTLRINLKTTATLANVTKLLRNITYRNQSTTAVSALKTLQFRVADGDGGTSSLVNKTIRIGSFNGNYTGTFVGRVNSFGVVVNIPGAVIPQGQNTVNTTVNGTSLTVSLPGLNANGTGTVSATGNFSSLSTGNLAGFGVKVQFTGTLKLNPNGTVNGNGTWTIVDTLGVSGSGTWTTSRPAP